MNYLMDLDFSDDIEKAEKSTDIDMNQEDEPTDSIFPLTLIQAVHESVYKKYYSYLLFETLRVFPSEEFKSFQNSSNILMIEYPEITKVQFKQNDPKYFKEDFYLPQKRDCKYSNPPCKFSKLFDSPIVPSLII